MKVIGYLLPFAVYFATAFNNRPKTSTGTFNKNAVDLQQDPATISLINLIANPDKYNGKQIRIMGYLHLEFEGNGLYLHKEDYDHAIIKNAIWVDVEPKHPEFTNLKQYSDHYVIMEGTFDSHMNGHMDVYSGSIKDITRLDIWPPSVLKPVKKKKL